MIYNSNKTLKLNITALMRKIWKLLNFSNLSALFILIIINKNNSIKKFIIIILQMELYNILIFLKNDVASNIEVRKLSTEDKVTYILEYTMLAFTLIGIGLNIFTFVVFLQKKFHKMAFSFYFRILLTSDTLLLLVNFNYFFEIVYSRSLDHIWIGFCKLLQYISYVSGAVSIWTISLILLDRFLSIAYCNRFLIIKKRRFQVLTVLLVIVINSIYYITIPIYRKLHENTSVNSSPICSYIDQRKAFIVYWSDLINMVLGCLILNNVLTALTLSCIFNSRKRIHKEETYLMSNLRFQDIKFAFNSIALNVVIFVCQTPISIILILSIYRGQSYSLFSVGLLLFTFRCSMSFVVNMVSNSIFYSQVLVILKLKSNSDLSNNTSQKSNTILKY